MGLLRVIESAPFCAWVRESNSLWAYPGILFLHTLTMAIVVGISVMVALRLLGFAPRLPVAPLARFFPVLWGAFWLSALSGTILLAVDATAKLRNPVFGLKMLLIALAAGDMVLVRRVVAGDAVLDAGVVSRGKLIAAAAVLLWLGAVTAGRLMAYLGVIASAAGAADGFYG